MLPIAPVTLADDVVLLEPLSPFHAESLYRASSRDRGTFGLTFIPSSLESWTAYVARFLEEQSRGLSVPFATRDARTGQVVGSTRFMTIERWSWGDVAPLEPRPLDCPDAVEIGSTWLAPEAQRTGINTHAKLLMLTHAFEVWEVRRVTLKTDARNVRSRMAIERLGAKLDGVLRAHMPASDGTVRNTALYSIIAAEWPDVKTALRSRSMR
jgi:RimJ/RimL family protein N-acetyltransferase